MKLQNFFINHYFEESTNAYQRDELKEVIYALLICHLPKIYTKYKDHRIINVQHNQIDDISH